MASAARKKSFLNYFGGGGGGAERVNPEAELMDFDESEVWNFNMDVVPTSDHQSKKSMINNNNSRPMSLKKPIKKSSATNHVNHRSMAAAAAATSLPVNIPDWSRILGDEYKSSKRRESEDDEVDDDDDEEDDEYGRLPPHEYLARTRGLSFSVHEGIGRTLKGRDLSRVRNAVWKQIGFED